MNDRLEDLVDILRSIVDFVSEKTHIAEEQVEVLFFALGCSLIVFITFFITRSFNKSRSHGMSTHDKREHIAAPSQENPSSQENASPPAVPESGSETNTEGDPGLESQKPQEFQNPQNESVRDENNPVSNPVKKTSRRTILREPAIIVWYKTHKSESLSVIKSAVKQNICDRIDEIVLPPAKVRMPYEATLDFFSRDLKDNSWDIEILKVYITPELKSLGLTCEKEQATRIRISGAPKEAYDGNLYFLLIHKDSKENLDRELQNKGPITSLTQYPEEYIHSKPFLINPDPRDLWNDLPVEDYEGYKNEIEDFRGEAITTNGQMIEILAASCRGRSHAHVGKPRDDCFHFLHDDETGWNYIAVADGAGSAKFSRKGSEIACHTAIQTLRNLLDDQITKEIFSSKRKETLKSWRTKFREHQKQDSLAWENEFVEEIQLDRIFYTAIHEAYMAIRKESQRKEGANIKEKDYHTTLLCAAFRYIKEMKSWFVASYWVGDGGAAILGWNGTDRVLVLGEPDGGEFAGQTRFLTMREEIDEITVRNRLRFSFCDSFDAILLATDGITDPFFPSESAVTNEPRWTEFYETKLKKGCEEEPEGCRILDDDDIAPKDKAEALLKWLGFWSKGNHDDRTLLIVKPQTSHANRRTT